MAYGTGVEYQPGEKGPSMAGTGPAMPKKRPDNWKKKPKAPGGAMASSMTQRVAASMMKV